MHRAISHSLTLLGIGLAASAFAHEEEKPADGHVAPHEEQLEIGRAGKPGDVQRTVVVEMNDPFAFAPAELRFKRGETVRLIVRNRGAMLHEWILGTLPEIEEHAELMRRFPNMEHDEPQQVRVPPGGVRELVWQFNRPGTFTYACLQPGHYEAGMKGIVEVK